MGPRTDPPKRLFLPLFRGQLSPPRPSDAEFIAGETATGPIFTPPRFPKCILQGGPYQSLWVRVAGAAVGAAGGSTSQQTGAEHHLEKSLAANLEQLLDSLPRIYRGLEDAQQFSDALQNHPSSPKQSGDEARRTDESSYAIYVALRQGEPAETALIPSLLSRGFRFHRFRDCNGEAQRFVVKEPLFAETDAELCYYRWEGPEQDRVPAFGSSNGGVGALILGPPPAADGGGGEPRTKVLLVFEYGWWKPVTGMVSRNESKFEALRRECTEEVGVEVETDEVYFVGGWQSCGAWDMEMNDEFSMFVVHTKSEDFHVDGEEIKEAQWVDIDRIVKAADAAGETGQGQEGHKGELRALEVEGLGRVSPKLVYWLRNHLRGTSFRCSVQENNRFFFN